MARIQYSGPLIVAVDKSYSPFLFRKHAAIKHTL